MAPLAPFDAPADGTPLKDYLTHTGSSANEVGGGVGGLRNRVVQALYEDDRRCARSAARVWHSQGSKASERIKALNCRPSGKTGWANRSSE